MTRPHIRPHDLRVVGGTASEDELAAIAAALDQILGERPGEGRRRAPVIPACPSGRPGGPRSGRTRR